MCPIEAKLNTKMAWCPIADYLKSQEIYIVLVMSLILFSLKLRV